MNLITRPLIKNGVDHRLVPLGKLPYRHDRRNLQLVKYLPRALPAAPSAYDWLSKASPFGPMGNLSVGDCTCAGAGHLIQTWTANQGKKTVIPDADILAVYSKLSGYVPGNPATDVGLALIDVLKPWQQTGIDGHKIGAYVQVDLTQKILSVACYLFGGLYCGVALPLSAQNQDKWQVPDPNLHGDAAPGSWGGHCVPMGTYDPLGAIFVTWGEEQYASEEFISAYFDEAWAIISQDFLDGKEDNPLGIDLATLKADLAAVQSEK